MQPVNVFEYETIARARMDPAYWDYFNGGSDGEVTLRANRSDFERIRLRPRVLVDISQCDTTTSVLGAAMRMPVLVAPSAFHRMAHPEGECATAQGAGAAGVVMIASTDATRSIEEIAQSTSGPVWLQLYLYPSREIAGRLVKRAEAAGCKAIVLTVDLPVLGNRERDRRNNLHIGQLSFTKANFVGVETEGGGPWVTVTWDDVAWLRSITSLPILLKGILTAEDALLALEYGVSGIVVSNHGGRQLDSCVTGIEALPEVVAAVAGRCEVLVDGGIRRGTDILKALALGARAVLVGRPVLWGLAAEGAEGVQNVLEILRTELEVSMKLAGCPSLAAITPAHVKLT